MSAPHQSSKGQAIDAACEDPTSVSPPPPSVAASSSASSTSGPAEASAPAEASNAFALATESALFALADEARCDVCGEIVVEDDDTDHASNGYAVTGRGLYIWSRGGETRYEEPPLCPSCASAVGVSALARWEIEEEEG